MLTPRGQVMAVSGGVLLLTWYLLGERELLAAGLIALIGVGVGVAKVAWDRTNAQVVRTIVPPQTFAGDPVKIQLRIEPESHASNVRIEDTIGAGRPHCSPWSDSGRAKPLSPATSTYPNGGGSTR